MCSSQDKFNNILQMKTTFKKIKPRKKPGLVCIHAMIINQQIISGNLIK